MAPSSVKHLLQVSADKGQGGEGGGRSEGAKQKEQRASRVVGKPAASPGASSPPGQAADDGGVSFCCPPSSLSSFPFLQLLLATHSPCRSTHAGRGEDIPGSTHARTHSLLACQGGDGGAQAPRLLPASQQAQQQPARWRGYFARLWLCATAVSAEKVDALTTNRQPECGRRRLAAVWFGCGRTGQAQPISQQEAMPS